MKLIVIFSIISFCCLSVNAQQLCKIDASTVNTEVKTGIFKMGNPGVLGKEIRVNNRYLTLDGQPVIPVMGEVHFSRIPKDEWENVILKMKACGINIIAAYVLWIHHEEIEGQFDWSGNKNLRAFAKLCAQHGMWFYPRIGPWCHAEVRNGGTPDWILQKTNLKNRSNDPIYQHYAEEWYRQVGLQLSGLMYKDGGPVIGIQLENEYHRGKSGESHILWLKKTAQKYGLDVPIYTVTGWDNASVPPDEVIPLWGAYPDEPWVGNLRRSTDCRNFQFSPFRNTDQIGNEVAQNKGYSLDNSDYPYFTCEMGIGIMNTDHRRLRIGALDGLGLVLAKLGSGSNLLGYYMFAGGSNPHGLLTTLEENKEETGAWNTNPVISYDFQAAIRESGELNKPYFEVKTLHYFLNEFGSRLAPMEPVFPERLSPLNYAVRSDGYSAFVFGLNYCRNHEGHAIGKVRFKLKLKNETLEWPSAPITIPDSAMFLWPVNFGMGKINLKYATAQPLCQLGNKWIFTEDAVASPEFCFDATNIESVNSTSGKVFRDGDHYIINGLKSGLNCVISVVPKSGGSVRVIVLSKEEARQVWLFGNGQKKFFFVSAGNMYMKGDKLHLFSTNNHFKIHRLNVEEDQSEIFTDIEYSVPETNVKIAVNKVEPLDKACWLKTSAVDKTDAQNLLNHRFFLKEFNLGNPSKIKKAVLLFAVQSACRIQVNQVLVNQDVTPGYLQTVDLTGYVSKGENNLLIYFPFELGNSAFAAKLQVEYFNTDRVEFSTDQSWLMRDSYNYPSSLTSYAGFIAPEQVSRKFLPSLVPEKGKKFSLTLPEDYLSGLNNLYLNISYNGDKGRLFFNHQLVADDFNDGSTWTIGLNRLNFPLASRPLILELTSLSHDVRVYFDDQAAKKASYNAKITDIHLTPEYQIDLDTSAEYVIQTDQ